MANILDHQKTIGIVGSNPDAHEFILSKSLGLLRMLCQTEERAFLLVRIKNFWLI